MIESKLKENVKTKQYRFIFSNIIDNEVEEKKEETLDWILKGYNDYKNNSSLMKNENIFLENFFKNDKYELSDFEIFNDHVQKTIIKNKAKKLKHRIISNKYKYLCNKTTESLFIDMAQMEFTKKELQDFVGKKISAFRHPEELNGSLMNLMDLKMLKDEESLLNRIKSADLKEHTDYKIILNKNNKIIIDIYSSKGAALLGSKMWCISREERMFNYYKEKKYTEYSFLYDFNKEPSDHLSMIAILSGLDGNGYEIYTKSDDEITEDPIYNNEIEEIRKIRKDSRNEEDYNIASQIRKLIKYPYKKSINHFEIKEGFFDVLDSYHMETFLNQGTLEHFIDQDIIDKNKDVFKQQKIDPINTINTESAVWVLEHKCEYTGDLIKELKKGILSQEGLMMVLTEDRFDNLMSYNQSSVIEFMSEDPKYYDNLIKYISHDKSNDFFKNKSIDQNLSYFNPAKLLLNSNFIQYLNKNKKIDILNKKIKNIDENGIKALKDSILFLSKNEEELDTACFCFSDIRSHIVDFKENGYMQKFHMRHFISKDLEMIKYFDFINDGKDTKNIESLVLLVNDIISEDIPRMEVNEGNVESYNRLLTIIDNIHEDRIKLINKAEDNVLKNTTIEVENEGFLSKLINDIENQNKNRFRYNTKHPLSNFIQSHSIDSFINNLYFTIINEHEKNKENDLNTPNSKHIKIHYEKLNLKINFILKILKNRDKKIMSQRCFSKLSNMYSISNDPKTKITNGFENEFINILKQFEKTKLFDFKEDLVKIKKRTNGKEDEYFFWKILKKYTDKNEINSKNKLN